MLYKKGERFLLMMNVFIPELDRYMWLEKQCFSYIENMLMFPFHDWILFRSFNTRELTNDTFWSKEVYKYQFWYIIIFEFLNFLVELSFNQAEKLRNYVLNIWLVFHETHVNCVQSSISVRKNWWDVCVGMWYGPHVSQCIRSKAFSDRWLFDTNESLLCLAKGHTLQGIDLLSL